MSRTASVEIDGPGGVLQAVVEDSGAQSSNYAVLCHPHPLMGGTMDNKVVTTLARAFQELAIPTVRFNFRGVGSSEGRFDAGIGETADADAVAAWGEAHWPGRRLMLAGFSFGSFVALRLAQQRPVEHLITIAPPVAMFDFKVMRSPNSPWLVVQGDADELVDAAGVEHWVQTLNPLPHLIVMPGVGHFFHGRLADLRDAVIAAIRSG